MVVVHLLLVPLSDCCQRLAADDGGDPEEDPLLGLPEGGGDAVPQDPWDGQAEARTLAPGQGRGWRVCQEGRQGSLDCGLRGSETSLQTM